MLKDIAPRPESGTVAKARKQRRAMSLPEVLIWRELRKRPDGLKFRRQHGSGQYVLDFYCSDARLAVEIDGLSHDMGNRPQRDDARDEWFLTQGIATIRVAARDVLRDVHASVEGIVAAAREPLPLHHPAAPGGPPPRDELGED